MAPIDLIALNMVNEYTDWVVGKATPATPNMVLLRDTMRECVGHRYLVPVGYSVRDWGIIVYMERK